jgi:hypothetical protein
VGGSGTGASPTGGGSAQGCTGDLKVSTNTCTDNASIATGTGKYWINNNVWNRSSLANPPNQQCSWLTCLSGNTLTWGTSFSWAGSTSTVKTYASVVLGWQWGIRVASNGLPVQISANRNINTGWVFTVTHNGTTTQNVAYDLWVHTISNPDSSNTGANVPSNEVMIWLYRSNGAGPLGSRVAQGINLGGTTWDLYEGPNTWTVHSFIRTVNTNSSTLNLRDFLDYLATNRGLSSAKYLTSVQAGAEIFTGTGQLDTSAYYCNVE